MPLPDAAVAAKPTLELAPSSALSIILNGPKSFRGRKLGIVLTDGSEAAVFEALTKAVEAEGALWEVIAPKIGGVTLDTGEMVAAKHKLDGAPSVLFDAVAVLPSDAGAALLGQDAVAKDFVSDAFAHCKFIGHSQAALTLFGEARIPPELDDGFVALANAKSCKTFMGLCADLRLWARELSVDADAEAFVKNSPAKRKE